MEEIQVTTNQKSGKQILCLLLAIALMVSLCPLGALKSEAYGLTAASPSQGALSTFSSKTASSVKSKTYVYDYMYGTYQGKYAVGVKKNSKNNVVQVDVVDATKGVTMSMKNSKASSKNDWLSYVIGVDGFGIEKVPNIFPYAIRVKDATYYVPYTFAGKKISNAKYTHLCYMDSTAFKGGSAAIFGRQVGSKYVIMRKISHHNGNKTPGRCLDGAKEFF